MVGDEMSEPQKLRIDIWSDIMCPWCLIGWGNLSQALDQLKGEIEPEIHWHAFELNPDMPNVGEERTAHIARKYGRSMEELRAVQDQMRDAATAAGVSLDYDGPDPEPPAMMWNTFAAHRLLNWVGEVHGPEKQTELELALFEAHFNERRHIDERNVLLDIAEDLGINRDAAADALDSEEVARRTRADERAAFDMNITGVPAMVVANKYLIPGAQPPEGYVDMLRRVVSQS